IANSVVGTCRYGYDAYHNRTSETVTGTLSGFGWSTFRARYYDGRLGRFIGRDPIGYAAGWTLFGYVRGRALIGVDPSGYGWNLDPGGNSARMFPGQSRKPRPTVVNDPSRGSIIVGNIGAYDGS